jgi:hypothetical protein
MKLARDMPIFLLAEPGYVLGTNRKRITREHGGTISNRTLMWCGFCCVFDAPTEVMEIQMKTCGVVRKRPAKTRLQRAVRSRK